MRTYLVAFFLAGIVAVVMTPIVRLVAPMLGAIDVPSGRRVHKKAIPRLGGFAILAGFLAPLVGLYFYDNGVSAEFHEDPIRSTALIAGTVAMAFLGALDDIRGTRAAVKLAAQIVIAVGTFAGGFAIESVKLPFVGSLEMGAFAAPITVFWIVGVVNAVNLLDGLDGLAAGVSFFVCIVSFVTGILSHNILVCLLSVSLGGALLGFLFFNFNPATIFMGDTGSLAIGYVLATTSLLGSKGGTAVALMVPVLAMGVPIIDTLLAIVRRFLERRPIFSPDRGHLHHRLLDMGLTHRRAVLAIYGMSLLFTGAAIVVYMGRTWQIGLALAVAATLVFAMVRVLGIVQSARANLDRTRRGYGEPTASLRRTIPTLLQELAETASGQQLLDQLTAFAEQSGLQFVACEECRAWNIGSWHWERPGGQEADGNYLSASYRLEECAGPSAVVTFGWISDARAVQGEVAILLQLAADALCEQLSREYPAVAE